ncbi:hypothetical protein ABZX30_09450 [Streptomyces sp. NPDC004542]|uniref:hypothetical protein n=1 Tax=Streptomyces sp. NPDC004542 TaxID=3154281 RepID=UPI0033B3D0F8
MVTLVAVVSAMSCGTRRHDPARRVRTVLRGPARGAVTVDEHVRVRLPARGCPALLGDVLIEHGTGAPRAAETASSHPGALVVAVHHGSRCWLRFSPDGTVLELEARTAPPEDSDDMWAALASLAHSWLVAGLPAAEFASASPYVLRTQLSDPPLSSRSSRPRADSASCDRDRPAQA